MALSEKENRELDRSYNLAVDNLMRQVREWVSSKGGVTGELHLKKTWTPGLGLGPGGGQWSVDLVEVRPTSTWILGL